MTTRNPFTPRNAYGKPMRLGKQQIYVLTALFDDDGNMRNGIARSAWLHKVCDSLVKHGLAGKGVEKMYDGGTRIMGVWEPRYELTVLGQSERERLRPLRRQNVQLPADLIPSNKTLRQSAHIEESMRDSALRGAELQMANEGKFAAMPGGPVDGDIDEAAYRRAKVVADILEPVDLATRVAIERWLAATYRAGFFSQWAVEMRKGVK